jgi:hypothetical protein
MLQGAADMDERRTEQDADEINEQMVRQMELRRQERPERRQRPSVQPVGGERRRICSFCYQPGDHRTANQCLGALERCS